VLEGPLVPEDVVASAPPPPVSQAPHPSPIEPLQFAQPLPDFVPPPSPRRSYRWLAWATVLITLMVLAFLATPANFRDALFQKTQSIAGSPATTNNSRPVGNSDSKSPITDARHATPATDPERDATKSDTLATKSLKVIIDPGHGGADIGTRGPNGLLEKNVCLEVALRLGQLIEDGLPGTEVIYTRSDDQNVSQQHRGAAANDSSANVFISIHADSLSASQKLQVYYLGAVPAKRSRRARKESGASDVALELAGDIQDAMVQEFALRAATGPTAAPALPAFSVLSNAQVPAVVAEIPFAEGSPLVDPDQRQKLAESMYRGIAAFLKERPENSSAASTN
jgi:N-acetylmuramoyl-L-alanine amidase